MAFDRDRNPFEFGRVLALSDGVFAIALTLLMLDLALPEAAARTTLGHDLVVAIWVASTPVQAVLMHRHASESGSPAPAAH